MSVAPNGSSDSPLPRAAPPHGFPIRYAAPPNSCAPNSSNPSTADPKLVSPPLPAAPYPLLAPNERSANASAHLASTNNGAPLLRPRGRLNEPDPRLAPNRYEMPPHPNHLALLLGGASRPVPRTSLGATGSGATGSGANGPGANISGANISGANGSGANISGAAAGTLDWRHQMDADRRQIALILQHRRTLVAHLKPMLRDASLPQDGVKKEKVARLLQHAAHLYDAAQWTQLHAFRRQIERHAPSSVNEPLNEHSLPPNVAARELRRPNALNNSSLASAPHNNSLTSNSRGSNSLTSNSRGSTPAPPAPPAPSAPPALLNPNLLANPLNAAASSGLLFWSSPFYTLGLPIRPPIQFRAPHASHKVSQQIIFTIDAQALSRTPNHVFLASQEIKANATGPQPMAFPFYTEISLDGHPLTVNTRGVRGTAGSAKPVDLRPYLLDPQQLRKNSLGERSSEKNSRSSNPNFSEASASGTSASGTSASKTSASGANFPEVTALAGPRQHLLRITLTINDQVEKMSTQSFKFGLFYGTVHRDDELLHTLTHRAHISQEETRALAMANAQPLDEDVLSSDAVLSLRDKIMFTRIRVPIRSRACTHIDCFDAASFLLLQAQAETWKCPVCNQSIRWDSLAVDDFFSEILSAAGPDADTVSIKPDGSWSVETVNEANDSSDDDSDEDWLARREAAKSKKDEEVVVLLSDTEDEDQEDRSRTNSLEPDQLVNATPNLRNELPFNRNFEGPSTQPDTTENYGAMPQVSVNKFMSAFCAADSGLLGGFPKPAAPQIASSVHAYPSAPNATPIDDDVIDLTADD